LAATVHFRSSGSPAGLAAAAEGELTNEMLAESLSDQIIVQAVGPLITVLLGGLAVGLIARQFQVREADQKLREGMALDVARIGGVFYSLVAATMRAKVTEDSGLIGIRMKALDDGFEKFIVDAAVLEKRLSAYSESCSLDWHAASDCATVLYYLMTEVPEPTLSRITTINEKGFDDKEHSRLSSRELCDQELVMNQFARQMNGISSGALKKSKNT
jgi:hypothetical protein